MSRTDNFRVDHLQQDLRARSVRGGTVTMAGQMLKFVLNIGSTMILARLLLPRDFGLVAMVTAVTGFVALFKDLGLSMATVQRAEVNHDQISLLFWVNVGLSALLMLLTAALAPAMAWFYGEPRLMAITWVLAATFVLSGLSVQHQALLRRQMRFTALMAIDVASMIVGIAAGVLAALAGAGYWALVAMTLGKIAVNLIGVWLLCRWLPGSPRKAGGVRSMLAFGANLTAFNIVNYFARNLDNVLIGRFRGAGPLGLYAKAYQLLLLPLQQINVPVSSVAIPVLSRLQNEPSKFRSYYRKAVLLVATLGMPCVGFMAVAADAVILTVLGDQWETAIVIFRWLSPAAFVSTFLFCTGWVYTSLGRADRMFRWGLAASAAHVVAFAIGIRWGAAGVAAAYSVSMCLSVPPGIWYCFRGSPLRTSDLVRALWRPAVAALLAGAFLSALKPLLPPVSPVAFRLLLELAGYTLCYGLLWCLLPGGGATLRDLARLAGDVLPKRGRAKSGA